MKQEHKSVKGITLIALVITIVVLLILAGVSIAMLTGENGILTQATNAKNDTTKAEAKERIELEVLGSYGTDGEINIAELKTNIAQNVPGAIVEGEELPLTVTLNGYIFTIESNGMVKAKTSGEVVIPPEVTPPAGTEITTADSYVGYYADIDADGDVDGIIYADLAVRGEGIWNNDDWSEYSYGPVTEGLKSYVVSEEETTGFGTWSKPVVTAVTGSGTVDRFYVMALNDVNPGTTYCWYDDAYGKLDDTIATDYNDFGEGKAKTVKMINAWNGTEYGSQDANENGYADMWGAVQPEGVNDDGVVTEEEITWFVPSKAEWSAFGDMTFSKIGVTTSTYTNYGLSGWYWSSAQYGTNGAYRATFGNGYVYFYCVNDGRCVRLSATF